MPHLSTRCAAAGFFICVGVGREQVFRDDHLPLTHLPVIVDLSHGTGIRNKVAPMARAAIAAGADGLIVEVHNDPDHALSDGAQSLYPQQYQELVDQIRTIAGVLGRRL